MVAKPPTIKAISSDRVMLATYGRTTSGASVWPTKILAAAARLSAPEVRKVRCMTQAKAATAYCTSPK